MSTLAALFIIAMAFVTATLSGVFGMAGGLVLMGALALVLPVSAAFVTHGVLQPRIERSHDLLGPGNLAREGKESRAMAYQYILSERLDKRNFRRRMIASGILTPTLSKRRDGSHRPAALYRFRAGDDAGTYLTPPWSEPADGAEPQ